MATRTTTTNAKGRGGPTTTTSGGMTATHESEYAVIRNCANICNETLAYCLGQGGEHVEENHLRSLIDCAEICNLTANFVARGSDLADDLKEVCASASKACEESCEEFGDDETMKRCADACRECAEHCRA